MNKNLKNLKIDASHIKRRVNTVLNADLRERKMYMKYRILKGIALAAALTVAFSVSVFAMTPTGQEAIVSLMSYFKNEKASEITSLEALAEYNDEIGASDSAHGYTLTLDNVAADDNFIHVFYTIKSEQPFLEDINAASITGSMVWADVAVDGKLMGYNSNHSEFDGYFEDVYTMKLVQKLNVSTEEIPDKFKLEILAADNPAKSDWDVDLRRLYQYEGDNAPTVDLTDEEKSKILYVCADIDKSKIKVNSVTKEINVPLWDDRAVAEKIILSPFANQLVVRSNAGEQQDENLAEICGGFALFDENGVCLDILNSDLTGMRNGVSRNAYEFLKADVNTKQIKFVPVKYEPIFSETTPITRKIGTYPMTFEVSDYGKIIVTDVRINDGVIEIDYLIDGYYSADPEFDILDDNGNNVYPKHQGGEMRCLYDVTVRHRDNSYTAKYQYYYEDENNNSILAKEEANAQLLRQSFTTIGLRHDEGIKLDFDNAVVVNLK